MREVFGPIIAIALVLIAVFVPLAFISGLTGQFYKQFALTIAISTVIYAVRTWKERSCVSPPTRSMTASASRTCSSKRCVR